MAKLSISNGWTQDFNVWLNTSHLWMLTWRPRGGPNSWSQDIPHRRPARAPSSKYQAWKLRPAQSSLVEIADTRMFKTKENYNGPRGSPCWMPSSEVRQLNFLPSKSFLYRTPKTSHLHQCPQMLDCRFAALSRILSMYLGNFLIKSSARYFISNYVQTSK